MTEDTLPETLYHYTTADGLLGILQEKALWATKIQYLNDASEFTEPIQVAENLLRRLARQSEEPGVRYAEAKREVYRRIREDLREWSSVNICVASFCAKGDLLSQWRGYGLPGAAYSIGFDAAKLAQTTVGNRFRLQHCTYFEPDDYRSEVQTFIQQVIEEFGQDSPKPVQFIDRFMTMAAKLKLKCFAEEDEWRIVSDQPLRFDDSRFGFRTGNSMVIPYYAVPLDLSSVVEIVVGPCAHQDLAVGAVHGLTNKYELTNARARVKTSQIPYRNY